MNRTIDAIDKDELKSLTLLLYLMPVFGVGPAMWTLSRPDRSKQERALSRLAIKLAMAWFAGTVMFDLGVNNSDTIKVPLLLASSLLTSGYFVLNLYLMLRLWQRKPVDVPFFGRVTRMS